MGSIGIDLSRWTEEGLLSFQVGRGASQGLETHLVRIQDAVSRLQPKVAVVDPVTSLTAVSGGLHEVELWEVLRAEIAPGDTVRLDAGCDKRAVTCREKFANILNFRGFPDIPGDNRLLTIPLRSTSTANGTGGK